MIDRIIDVFHIVSEIDNPQSFRVMVQGSGHWSIFRMDYSTPIDSIIWVYTQVLTPGPQRHPLNTGIVWETGMCHKNRMEVTTRG